LNPAWHGPCNDANPANPTDTNCWSYPYIDRAGLSHNDRVEVRLHVQVHTFFTGVVDALVPGHPLGNAFFVSARSVGAAVGITSGYGPSTSYSTSTSFFTDPGSPRTTTQTISSVSTSSSTITNASGNIALFAKDTTCGSNGSNGITLGSTGNSLKVTGLSISNGSVWVDGNPQTHLDLVNYGGPNTCSIGGSQGSAAVGTLVTHSDNMDWPQTWDKSAICNSAGAQVHYFKNDLATDVHTITGDGIWCADNGTLALSANNSTMHISVIGPKLNISAQHLTLTPYPASNDPLTNNLLFYQTQGDFQFLPNNSNITGWIWVENGRLTYGGNSASQGFYEAQDISIQGNSFNILGNGPVGPPVTSTTFSTTTNLTTTTYPYTTIGGATRPIGTTTSTLVTPGSTSTVATTVGLGE
jgi:hypothetical protein